MKRAAVGRAPAACLGTRGVRISNYPEGARVSHPEPRSILEIRISRKKTKSGPDGLVGGLARGAARSPVDYKPSHRTLASGEVAVPMTQGHGTRCPGQTEKREHSPPTKASTHASLPAPGSDRCSSTDYCAGLVPPLSRVKTQATHSTQSNGPPS